MRLPLSIAAFCLPALAAGPDPRGILQENCAVCHNDKNATSGLSLATRQAVLAGGKRGPAAAPGKAASSLIVAAMRQSGELKMPPGRKLSAEEVAAVAGWIDQGMEWRGDADSTHWAFRPVRRPALPAVRNTAWPRNALDRFLLAAMEAKNVAPAPEAGRRALLRRVSLDLTGLPPTPAELEAFLSDTRPDAYERAVDRLLASPGYGERWARVWLDLARYADSNGYTIDAPRQMWKYRDWVIEAINRDMPFDQFTIEQFGGDLLPNPTQAQLIATGFHRNTPSNEEGGIDVEQYRVEAVADRVATTGEVFLGLTLGCARCHDHKYDPIAQKEFYQFFAFLNNTDEMASEADRKTFNKPILELATPEEIARRDEQRQKIAAMQKQLRGLDAKSPEAEQLRKDLAALRLETPPITSALIMKELPAPRPAYVHLGGDFLRKGPPVAPNVLAVLPPLENAAAPTRLDLGRWLVDKRNPLTPRVTVNRLWQRYFGRGIVESQNDFGRMGDRPTHPELLDWLAAEFQEGGWSQKAIHRLIATSAAYRQSSGARPELAAVDPDNRLFARQTRQRLDAELVRDAALRSSGLLAAKVGGPSVYPPLPPGAMSVTQVNRPWKTSQGEDRYRRGLYTFVFRSAVHAGLAVFDAPDGTATCTRRNRSNTPLQALTVLNDEAFFETARALARRVLDGAANESGRLAQAFELALSRQPKAAERDRLLTFLHREMDAYRGQTGDARDGGPQPELAAWTSVARVLLNLDEFLTRE